MVNISGVRPISKENQNIKKKKMKAFDETPSNSTCETIEKLVTRVLRPSPCGSNEMIFFDKDFDHFSVSRVSELPKPLDDVIHMSSVSSGWIEDVELFWAADPSHIFFFAPNMVNFHIVQTAGRVTCAGFSGSFIVVSYDDGSLQLYTYPGFEPLHSSYSVPRNVLVTVVRQGIVGCNDGSLRRITINQKKLHCAVSGIFSIAQEDPVVSIIETENYYVSLTLNSVISVFSKAQLTKIASFKDAKKVLSIWSPHNDVIFALDSNAFFYSLSLNMGSIMVKEKYMLIAGKQFQTVCYKHGFLTAVDNSKPLDDCIYVSRFAPTVIFGERSDMGLVLSLGSSSTEILFFTAKGVYAISEKLINEEIEELWRFANLIAKYWDLPITELPFSEELAYLLNGNFHSDNEILSAVCHYVMTIIDDIKVLQNSEFEKLFSRDTLSHLFSKERLNTFSRLRKISFEIRFLNQQFIEGSSSELNNLIKTADAGDDDAAATAMNIIGSSFETLPPDFPLYCRFMIRHRFYREFLEAVISWANSVMSDDQALAMENANFPSNNYDDIASYHLRLRVYEQINPFLEIAVSGNDIEAKEALKFALNLNIEVFQKYVLQYFENNCPSEQIAFFEYPEMIEQMKEIESKHLPDLYIANNNIESAYRIYIDTASSDSNNLSISDRINRIKKAQALYPQKKSVKKLLDCANLLTGFIIDNQNVPQNLFAKDFIDINDVLVDFGEYALAIEVMKIFHEKRMDVLEMFLKVSDSVEVSFLIKSKPVFTQLEIARELYHIKGADAFDFMFDCNIENQYIFKVLCELWQSGKMRNDIEIIVNALKRAGRIHRSIRQSVADMLCDIIVDLDFYNEKESADMIRLNLEHCFLDQTFEKDINDT